MHLKWQEAAIALIVILALIGAKHLPALAGLPMAQLTGIACFAAAIFFAYRLMQIDIAERESV